MPNAGLDCGFLAARGRLLSARRLLPTGSGGLDALFSQSSMRVAVIMGGVIPEQLALWHAVRGAGVGLTIVGTDFDVYRGKFPWHPRRPTDIDTVILRLRSPAPIRGQVWWTYEGLYPALRRLRPDLLHVVSEPWGALVSQTLFARRSVGKRVPLSVHGADNIFDHGTWPERVARRVILSRVWPRIDAFVSWSGGGIDAARGAGLPAIPTTVVPAVVPDPALFPSSRPSDLRARFGLPRDEPVVGYLGRLDEEKGIEDLLQAMGSLGPSAPFFAVWGAGRLEGLVRHRLSAGELRGKFGGPLGFAYAPRALQACDVIVVPSRTTPAWKEQFGRVIVEAMLAGAAVVAYRSGAIPEAAGDGALLVDEGDVSGLAAAIQRLTTDSSLRSELAARGREGALARFHPNVLAERLVRFWSEVRSR